VEIIPQTMPPFPWHFGGQSHHNLFMDPDEIVAFCMANDMRVCLDLSHSQLACNHFGWSMSEFCRKVGRYAAHLHVVDAKGVDGEGLQIGEGTWTLPRWRKSSTRPARRPRSSPRSGRATRTGARASGRRSTRSNRGSAAPPRAAGLIPMTDLASLIVPGLAYGLTLGRGGSQGLPGKNVRPLGGHPLIAWSVAAGRLAQGVARVLCSTDDEAIAQAARIAGADVPFLRPAAFATSAATDLDVFTHAVEWLAQPRAPARILRATAPHPTLSRGGLDRRGARPDEGGPGNHLHPHDRACTAHALQDVAGR
jgi:hypothetical protein